MRTTNTAPSSGQGLVEFALALPLFMLLLFGLIDGGRMVIEYSTLTNASRAGARVAVVNQSNGSDCASFRTFKCAVADHAGPIGLSAGTIADLPAPACTGEDCTVTVRVEHTFELITPIASSLLGPIDFAAETTMPVERLYANP